MNQWKYGYVRNKSVFLETVKVIKIITIESKVSFTQFESYSKSI